MRKGGSIVMADLDPTTILVTDERPTSDKVWVRTLREGGRGHHDKLLKMSWQYGKEGILMQACPFVPS
jgi:hypothetical protein